MPVPFACHGGGEQPLKVCLRRITESKSTTEIPQELLTPVVEASHDTSSRRDIMKHLRECLSEPTGKRWHRIYAGLLLVEKLMQRGSRTLVIELAHGHHFDLIQKVSLLEHFDSTARGVSNPWAQHMIRKKAGELRGSLVPQLEKASAEELPRDAVFFREMCSMSSSPGGASTSTGSTAACSSLTSISPLGTPLSTPPQGQAGFLARLKRHNGAAYQSPEALAAMSPRSRLRAELNRITESGLIDMPPELFTFVVEAAQKAEGRGTIVRHVRGCLLEPTKKRWTRIYAALSMLESIMHRAMPGTIEDIHEAANAQGFNLVRQVWVLQEFEYRPDWRAQNLIRKKARYVHDGVAVRLQGGDAEPRPDAPEVYEKSFATLRMWAESVELQSAPSESSSRPSTESEVYSDEPDRQRSMATTSHRSHKSAVSADDEVGFDRDAFFTPMATPAIPRAVPRPRGLLSL